MASHEQQGAALKDTFHLALTLLAIIQGVVFAFLAENTFKYVFAPQGFTGSFLGDWAWAHILPYSLMSLMIFIIVSYEYIRFASFYEHPPIILDVIVTSSLGLAELAPAAYLSKVSSHGIAMWWFLAGIFCLSGGLAWPYSLLRCRNRLRSDGVYEKSRTFIYQSSGIAFLTACICGYRFFFWQTTPIVEFSFSVAFVIMGSLVLVSEFRFVRTAPKTG
jgi:hypothetical protein